MNHFKEAKENFSENSFEILKQVAADKHAEQQAHWDFIRAKARHEWSQGDFHNGYKEGSEEYRIYQSEISKLMIREMRHDSVS